MSYIREYRMSANLNQAQLAERLNVSQPCISRWEHGSAYPEAETAKRMSEILNMPFELIYDHKKDPDPHPLPIYDIIPADGPRRKCTKAGALLLLSEREMAMLTPRAKVSETENAPSGPEVSRFYGFYCASSTMIPTIMPDSINVIYETQHIYSNAIHLVCIEGENAIFARLVGKDGSIVAILESASVTCRHFRSSDLKDGTLQILGVVVQTRNQFLL